VAVAAQPPGHGLGPVDLVVHHEQAHAGDGIPAPGRPAVAPGPGDPYPETP
jgi:hypothetical protein